MAKSNSLTVKRGEEFWAGTCGTPPDVLLHTAARTRDGAWARLATYVAGKDLPIDQAKNPELRSALVESDYRVRKFIVLEVAPESPE